MTQPGTDANDIRERIVQIVARGERPTLAEIADELGVKAPTIHYHVERLITEGRLQRREGRHRDLRVVA